MASGTGKSFGARENERIRAAARELLAENDGNQRKLATTLKVAQPTISNLLSGRSGAGVQLATAIAKAKGVTLDELMGGARPPELTVEREDRYANRAEAAAFARRSGLDPRAIEIVNSMELQAHEDPSPEWWFERMRSERDRLRYATPESEAVQRRKDEATTNAAVEAVQTVMRGTTPKKPKKT